MSVQLLFTQPQPTQQTLATSPCVTLPPLLDSGVHPSPPPPHLYYYCIYVNRTPPQALLLLLLLFLSVNDVKQHDQRGGKKKKNRSRWLVRTHTWDAQPHAKFLLTRQNAHALNHRGATLLQTRTHALIATGWT